jgi:cyclopropane fatty-acyl-phospholipid synthase-like methyltransferase
MSKPYSPACDQNRDPILEVIQPLLDDAHHVLEIGSGTGQHAVYFGRAMPHLIWQTSDLEVNHAGIRLWLDEAGLDNVRAPLSLDVTDPDWPAIEVDAVFTANTFHIMSWEAVAATIAGSGRLLSPGGRLMVYGPFSYSNRHTSDSNARFDTALRQSDPTMGVRDFEDLDTLAIQAGLSLERDYPMPVNNRILVWRKG